MTRRNVVCPQRILKEAKDLITELYDKHPEIEGYDRLFERITNNLIELGDLEKFLPNNVDLLGPKYPAATENVA